MDGEQNGAETQVEERQGVEGGETVGGNGIDSQEPKGEEVSVTGNGAEGDDGNDGHDGGDDTDKAVAEYRAALVDRDKKIAELEAQIADAAKTVESANALAKQIEELKEATDAERVGYELKLAGCRSVRAGRVLLADHKGDMAALKKAEPWLFGDAVGTGATGLEPAGASKGESDEMKRWMAIAGVE